MSRSLCPPLHGTLAVSCLLAAVGCSDDGRIQGRSVQARTVATTPVVPTLPAPPARHCDDRVGDALGIVYGTAYLFPDSFDNLVLTKLDDDSAGRIAACARHVAAQIVARVIQMPAPDRVRDHAFQQGIDMGVPPELAKQVADGMNQDTSMLGWIVMARNLEAFPTALACARQGKSGCVDGLPGVMDARRASQILDMVPAFADAYRKIMFQVVRWELGEAAKGL